MKLTKDDIVFLDTYLINKEVICENVYQEILNPFALALEEKTEVEN